MSEYLDNEKLYEDIGKSFPINLAHESICLSSSKRYQSCYNT